ncbi:hypothetical protein [Thalassotalea sp. Y01]|uniref:hypothetical protein n=1 Tax=Thalassotalea sp. Y01 TaxID=2729613 RepID=UPI00145D6B3E|nr:hypothetical protein [Thalassotalea sp. Y01]NMP15451.1 hypothetical protein [Thalassotalea sp. Y01]
MEFNAADAPYIMLFSAVIPALLAVYQAKIRGRSKLISGMATFALGFTFIGGWLYLATLMFSKEKLPQEAKS